MEAGTDRAVHPSRLAALAPQDDRMKVFGRILQIVGGLLLAAGLIYALPGLWTSVWGSDFVTFGNPIGTLFIGLNFLLPLLPGLIVIATGEAVARRNHPSHGA
jgi:hypothetical protein